RSSVAVVPEIASQLPALTLRTYPKIGSNGTLLPIRSIWLIDGLRRVVATMSVFVCRESLFELARNRAHRGAHRVVLRHHPFENPRDIVDDRRASRYRAVHVEVRFHYPGRSTDEDSLSR